MIDTKAIRAAAEAAKGLPDGDWNYEPIGQTVWNERTHTVCDIRGWGHLGNLPNGAELQDAMGRHIANMSPVAVIALLDRLEAAEKDAARYRWLRDGNDHKDNPAMQIAINSYGCEWDEAIDAAMKEPK